MSKREQSQRLAFFVKATLESHDHKMISRPEFTEDTVDQYLADFTQQLKEFYGDELELDQNEIRTLILIAYEVISSGMGVEYAPFYVLLKQRMTS